MDWWNVHARAVVAEDRLRHEGCRLAIGIGDLVHDILVDLHLVGAGDERIELHTQLVLCSSHFVVMLFDDDTHFGEKPSTFRNACPAGCRSAEREVTALDARTVTEVAGLVVGVVVGRQFGRIELEAGIVGVCLVLHVVEDEEFRLGARRKPCRRYLMP